MEKKIVKGKPRTSQGFIWIVYDGDGDPIQAWDEDEEVVRKHVLEFGWSYSGLPAFRKSGLAIDKTKIPVTSK